MNAGATLKIECLSVLSALRSFTHLYESAARERIVTCHDDSRRCNGETVISAKPASQRGKAEQKRRKKASRFA